MKQYELNIVDKAIIQFEQQTGLQLERSDPDQIVTLTLADEVNQWTFTAEIKVQINKGMAGILKNQFRNYTGKPLLVTTYVNPELMKTLVNLDINFIDTAGNAYIKVPPLFIKIGGNKLADTKIKTRKLGRAFETAGMQIIFALLCNKGLERKTYREIAGLANVALGTTHIVMKDLEELGFVIDTGNRGKLLVKKEQLLKRWVTQYPEKLRPKYYIGNFQTDNDDLVNNIDLRLYDGLWGGETAAARLTNYLNPMIQTIYIGDKQNEFILRNRLKKTPNGEIELVNKFWKFAGTDDITVPPILIYADLLATGDPRNIETAGIIYEQEIIRYLGED